MRRGAGLHGQRLPTVRQRDVCQGRGGLGLRRPAHRFTPQIESLDRLQPLVRQHRQRVKHEQPCLQARRRPSICGRARMQIRQQLLCTGASSLRCLFDDHRRAPQPPGYARASILLPHGRGRAVDAHPGRQPLPHGHPPRRHKVAQPRPSHRQQSARPNPLRLPQSLPHRPHPGSRQPPLTAERGEARRQILHLRQLFHPSPLVAERHHLLSRGARRLRRRLPHPRRRHRHLRGAGPWIMDRPGGADHTP